MPIYSQSELNSFAKKIREQAKSYLKTNTILQEEITTLIQSNDTEKLFAYCISHCKKPEGHFVVSYILDNQALDFINTQDNNKDTLLHYAAKEDYAELMYVLNEQKSVRARFVLENLQQKTPLDLCCDLGNENAFMALWPRVGKSNHDPSGSLINACQGGNENIITVLLTHPKIKQSPLFQPVLLEARKNTYSANVNQLIVDFEKSKQSIQSTGVGKVKKSEELKKAVNGNKIEDVSKVIEPLREIPNDEQNEYIDAFKIFSGKFNTATKAKPEIASKILNLLKKIVNCSRDVELCKISMAKIIGDGKLLELYANDLDNKCALDDLKNHIEGQLNKSDKEITALLDTAHFIAIKLNRRPERQEYAEYIFYLLQFLINRDCDKLTCASEYNPERKGITSLYTRQNIKETITSLLQEILARQTSHTPFTRQTKVWVNKKISIDTIKEQYARLDALDVQVRANSTTQPNQENHENIEQNLPSTPEDANPNQAINLFLEEVKVQCKSLVDKSIRNDTTALAKLKKNLDEYDKEIDNNGSDKLQATKYCLAAAYCAEGLAEASAKKVSAKDESNSSSVTKRKVPSVVNYKANTKNYLEKADKLAQSEAYFEVGYRYYHGETLEQHDHWARVYLEKSCKKSEKGIDFNQNADIRAYYYLAKMYFEGRGGDIDILEARKLFNKVVELLPRNQDLLKSHVPPFELNYFRAELELMDYFDDLHQDDFEHAQEKLFNAAQYYTKSLENKFTTNAFLSLLTIYERELNVNKDKHFLENSPVLQSVMSFHNNQLKQKPELEIEIVRALGLESKLNRKEKQQFFFRDYLIWLLNSSKMSDHDKVAITSLPYKNILTSPSTLHPNYSDAEKMLTKAKHEKDSLPMRKLLLSNADDQSAKNDLINFYNEQRTLLIDTFLFEFQRGNQNACAALEPIIKAVLDVSQPNIDGQLKNELAKLEYEDGRKELNVNKNTYYLRKILADKEHKFNNNAKNDLIDFFKLGQNNLILLTIYLYELRRHSAHELEYLKDLFEVFSSEIKLLVQAINDSDSEDGKFKKIRVLDEKLQQEEQKNNTYYDDNLSDDSEPESDRVRQKTDPISTLPKHSVEDMVNSKIKKRSMVDMMSEGITKILTGKATEKEIQAKFIPYTFQKLTSRKYSTAVQKDLITLNYYAAKGEPHKAMELIQSDFIVAQMRGIHFYTNKHSKRTRNQYVKLSREFEHIKDSNNTAADHPLKQNAIYSEAVYQHAQLNDFLDLSDLAITKLNQSNRYIYCKTKEAMTKPAYKEDELPPDSAFTKNMVVSGNKMCKSLRSQTQYLYTSNYEAHKQFLTWESSGQKGFVEPKGKQYFVNNKSFYVSTADMPSIHGFRYTFGSKIYGGHEDENRIRPRFDENQHAHRSYVGALSLCLIPIQHIVYRMVNHVPSMAYKFDIDLRSDFIYERESSFLGIEKGDILYVLPVRFPSFHHAEYLSSFLPRYGISKSLYFQFKEALSKTKPHQKERKQLILLLSEYISAFLTKRMCQMAIEKSNKRILIYRTPEGNFSLFPYHKILPFPNGDEYLFTRQRSRFDRQVRFGDAESVDDGGEDFAYESDEDDEDGITPTKGQSSTPLKRNATSTDAGKTVKRVKGRTLFPIVNQNKDNSDSL